MSKNGDLFGERQKLYELTKDKVTIDDNWAVRLDGRSFSTLMKKSDFDYPFDPEYQEGMHDIVCELLDEFGFDFAYFQSDEISLYKFPIEIQEDGSISQLMFGGKQHKLLSLTAAHTSMLFAKQFSIDHEATFDSRIMVFPDTDELINNCLWRMKNCERNCIQQNTIVSIGPKKAHGLKIKDQLNIINELYQNLTDEEKYGTLICDNGIISEKQSFKSLKLLLTTSTLNPPLHTET